MDHKTLELQIMIDLQKHLPLGRVFRFDAGTAFVPFSVEKFIKTRNRKDLQRVSYGVVGFPDLLFIGYGKMVGVEVKVGKDVQSPGQIAMQKTFLECGHEYVLFTDKQEYKKQIEGIVCLIA